MNNEKEYGHQHTVTWPSAHCHMAVLSFLFVSMQMERRERLNYRSIQRDEPSGSHLGVQRVWGGGTRSVECKMATISGLVNQELTILS